MRDLRIAHIADSHLGYRSSTLPGRDEDFAKSWVTACRAIVDSAPDLIIHAGDVFHHPNPSWGAVATFLDGAHILREANVPVFMISGNHDTSRILTKHTIFSVLTASVPWITISHDTVPIWYQSDEVDVVLVSHRALINPALRKNLDATVGQIGSNSKYTILVSHGSVGDLESSAELGSVVVPDFLFYYPWSYIALGHLHLAQPATRNGWYSGSIERCGWSDYPASPAWTETVISKDNPIRHKQRGLPHLAMLQLQDLYCPSYEPDEIVQEIMHQVDDLNLGEARVVLRILLKGPHHRTQRTMQNQASRLVREKYPNAIMQVVIENTEALLNPKREPGIVHKTISIEDTFREFVAQRVFDDPAFGDKLLDLGLAKLAIVRAAEAESDGIG